MKKIYLCMLVLGISLSSCINFNPKNKEEEIMENPQDDAVMESSSHLKFKGVPIDGNLNEFVSRMKQKGVKHVGTQDEIEIMCGDFADFKECLVYVTTLDEKDLVSKIAVAFPSESQWEYLYGDYKHLKELLTEKYGKPSSCVEKFQTSYGDSPSSDEDKMYSVNSDRCKYETRFTVDNGEIVLWIEHEDVSSCFVMLLYKDKVNGSVIREHAKRDL